MLEKLGSYNDFLRENNIEHSPESLEEYSLALSSLRITLAQERGIDLEDLHSNQIKY